MQPQVDKKSATEAVEQRKKIMNEATAALSETHKAIEALDEEDRDAALASLERATGKLELILARDPALGLAPVDVDVVTYDLIASPDTVRAMIHDAENYLEDGEIPEAQLDASVKRCLVISRRAASSLAPART